MHVLVDPIKHEKKRQKLRNYYLRLQQFKNKKQGIITSGYHSLKTRNKELLPQATTVKRRKTTALESKHITRTHTHTHTLLLGTASTSKTNTSPTLNTGDFFRLSFSLARRWYVEPLRSNFWWIAYCPAKKLFITRKVACCPPI